MLLSIAKVKILTFGFVFCMATGMMAAGGEGQLRKLPAGETQVVVRSGTEVAVT